MADALYLTAPRYIVEFPDITVPESHKVVDFSGYVPVQSFSEAGRQPLGGVGPYSDGNQEQMECIPVLIQSDPIICGLLIRIIGVGLLADKKIKMIELGREKDSGQTERYEAELEGIVLTAAGPTGVLVTYQEYESKRYRKEESTLRQAYDFVGQKAKD